MLWVARAESAVANGENVRIACGLESRQHDQLVAAANLQPAKIAQHVWPLDASRPDDQLREDEVTIGEPHSIRTHFGHSRADADLDAEVLQQPHRCLRNAGR